MNADTTCYRNIFLLDWQNHNILGNPFMKTEFFIQVKATLSREILETLILQQQLITQELERHPEFKAFWPDLINGIEKTFFSNGGTFDTRDLSPDRQHANGPIGMLLVKLLLFISQFAATPDNVDQNLVKILDRYDYEITYARQYDLTKTVDDWCEHSGSALYKVIRKIGCLMEQITALNKLQALEDFFLDFLNPERADINIISIGCGGIPNQQVYPWVFQTASKYPRLNFKIDLFDKFDRKNSAMRSPLIRERYLGMPRYYCS